MEIKDLRIFQSVAEAGSISKGAKALNFVQSHVTARIKVLETELDTQLFLRHSRGATLTSEGMKLEGYARQILGLIDDMEKDFKDIDSPTGSLCRRNQTADQHQRQDQGKNAFHNGFSFHSWDGFIIEVPGEKVKKKQNAGAFCFFYSPMRFIKSS